ncbi:MAG TPA: TonB-dependent receptor, partial [Rhizomicrobium sp.]|nr:TonB-dependent receptor [Rhizomicrobium sp.]
LDLKYTFDNGIALRSITGYAAGGGSERVDLDGTAIPAFHGIVFHDHGEEKIVSEELNLLSPTTGPLTWILGGYFQHDHVDLPAGYGFDIGVPAGTVDIALEYHTPKEHEAVFGQATYDVTSALQVQLGLRFNHSTFDLESNQQTLFLASIPLTSYLAPCPATIPAGLVCSNQVHQSDSALTGKLDVNYKLDADNFLYAFVATGHKDGALNTTPDINGPGNPPGEIKPERLIDYEVGWKSNLFDDHLRTTLDAFYNNYHDFQVTLATSPGQSAILNTKTANIYGFEAQGNAVFGQLSFDFAGSYVHGAFGSDVVTDPRFFDAVDINGHQMVYSPHFTFDFGAQYDFQLGNGDTLTPRVDYAFVDSQTTSIFNVPGLDQLGVRHVLNLQLTYAFQDNWEITAFATNVADDKYIAAFSAGAPISSNLRNAGPPRQFGVRVTKAF